MKDSDIIFGLMASLGKPEYSIADLLYLLQPFNISETCLRTTLSRLSNKNLLTSRRDGKTVYHRFSDKGEELRTNVARAFRSLDWSDWDESWWGVLFSIPDIQKAERYRIRKKLLAYRFVPLFAGSWIRPFHPHEKLELRLKNIADNEFCKMIRFHYVPEISIEEVQQLWRLDEINDEFQVGLEKLSQGLHKIKHLSPTQALVEKIYTGGEIVPLLFKDPLLPDQFLPDKWKGEQLKNHFLQWDEKITQKSKAFWGKVFC